MIVKNQDAWNYKQLYSLLNNLLKLTTTGEICEESSTDRWHNIQQKHDDVHKYDVKIFIGFEVLNLHCCD